MNLLEISNLRIGFTPHSEEDVLKGISLDIPPASITGLVGESGSGKTLTAYSVLKLLDSNAHIKSGSVNFHDGMQQIDILKLGYEDLRKIRGNQITMVFQEAMAAMNPVLKCGFQISEVVKAHYNLSKSELKDKAFECFLKVGLKEPQRIFDAYPFELSGGQIQRVLIALAIINKPKLIIADEPTTALDVNMQKKVIELFKDIHEELGSSILFISHDLGLVKDLCQQISVMQAGRIVESGSVAKIFNAPGHHYTKGLIHCKPPLFQKVKKLWTLTDFKATSTEQPIPYEIYSNDELLHKSQQLTKAETLLSVENLSITYQSGSGFFLQKKRKHTAVSDVSFTIKRGEVLGLVGESGSGKTSIGRCIVRLLEPQQGSILYCGTDMLKLRGKSLWPLRKEIQMIFQDPYSSLNPRQKIGPAIQEPLEIHKLYENSKQRKERVMELLQIVGMESDHYNRYPHQFSGGQRQRICIARALSVEPKLLVCDEPVSALDVSVQAQVLNLFKELQDKFNLSYLFISHDLAVVHYLADRILVLQNGEVVEEGFSSQVINHPQHTYTKSLIMSTPH